VIYFQLPGDISARFIFARIADTGAHLSLRLMNGIKSREKKKYNNKFLLYFVREFPSCTKPVSTRNLKTIP
jgi:hypothetical protein